MDNRRQQQDALRRFFRQIEQLSGLSLSAIARRALMAHTTLTRFVNNENVTWTPSMQTFGAIRRAVADKIPPEQFDALWAIAQRGPPEKPRPTKRR